MLWLAQERREKAQFTSETGRDAIDKRWIRSASRDAHGMAGDGDGQQMMEEQEEESAAELPLKSAQQIADEGGRLLINH
jgi:hypothetical protein